MPGDPSERFVATDATAAAAAATAAWRREKRPIPWRSLDELNLILDCSSFLPEIVFGSVRNADLAVGEIW